MDSGEGGEAVVVDPLEVGQVAGDDPLIAPERSRARSRRWQGETLRPTRSASSVMVRRPSCCSTARICRSKRSMKAKLFHTGGPGLRTLETHAALPHPIFHYRDRVAWWIGGAHGGWNRRGVLDRVLPPGDHTGGGLGVRDRGRAAAQHGVPGGERPAHRAPGRHRRGGGRRGRGAGPLAAGDGHPHRGTGRRTWCGWV